MGVEAVFPDLFDKGGRRIGIDRRLFFYTDHVPSRRSNKDRRSGLDRRNGLDRRSKNDRRSDQKDIEIERRKDSGRRCGIERRVALAVTMNG